MGSKRTLFSLGILGKILEVVSPSTPKDRITLHLTYHHLLSKSKANVMSSKLVVANAPNPQNLNLHYNKFNWVYRG